MSGWRMAYGWWSCLVLNLMSVSLSGLRMAGVMNWSGRVRRVHLRDGSREMRDGLVGGRGKCLIGS